jgi:hypothetical protein
MTRPRKVKAIEDIGVVQDHSGQHALGDKHHAMLACKPPLEHPEGCRPRDQWQLQHQDHARPLGAAARGCQQLIERFPELLRGRPAVDAEAFLDVAVELVGMACEPSSLQSLLPILPLAPF